MSEEARPARPSGIGTVMLDIGGEVGALVLHTPASLEGAEPEIHPLDGSPPVHTSVRRRELGASAGYAAVYPSLPAGWYRIGEAGQVVCIQGGQVTEVDFALSA